MKKSLITGVAMALGLAAPLLTLAASSDYYNDYSNDYYNSDYTTSGADSAAGAAIGLGMMAFFGVLALVGLAFFIFEIMMIMDCVKRDFEQRTVWLVVLIVGLFFGYGWLAAVIYYFTVKHKNVGKPMVHAGTTPPPAAKQ